MDFSLEFLGAAGEVTGSRTLLRANGSSVLVDCGLFQGPKDSRERNWARFPVPPETIAHAVLTHAHLDHSGYFPRLWRQGFRGSLHCSTGTADIVRLLLLDAAHLEEEQAAYANRSGYSNHKPALPLFTEEDVHGLLAQVQPHVREEWIQLGPRLSCRFLRAGHIIGASMVQLAVTEEHATRLVTFTGDVGHARSVTMRPPAELLETDILVLESTYGDRLHPREGEMERFAEVVSRTVARAGVVVIPAFAVGRAQEVLHLIRVLEDRRMIPTVPVILDSPMAAQATEVFRQHEEDHRLGSVFSGGIEAFLPRNFEVTSSPDESMLACMRDGPLIVISASGMLTGGRVLHHLKARLPDSRNTVLFTGYQAEGTKGRFLLDSAGQIESLRIHHVEVPLAAEVVALDSLSGHGDHQDLIEWIGRIRRKPHRIFLNHGAPHAMESFAGVIRRTFPKIEVTTVVKPMRISSSEM